MFKCFLVIYKEKKDEKIININPIEYLIYKFKISEEKIAEKVISNTSIPTFINILFRKILYKLFTVIVIIRKCIIPNIIRVIPIPNKPKYLYKTILITT